MKSLNRTLVNKLVVVVLLKLAVLTAIWWLFIRDERVHVDTQRVTSHLLSPSDGPSSGGKP